MKRIIAAIVVAVFVFTQTGISFALRQENYEVPAEGGASGIGGSSNRAGEILGSFVNPFIRGWQQNTPAVVYTPHEKEMKTALIEALGNRRPVNIEMQDGTIHSNVIVRFRSAIDMFGIIDAKGKDKGYLPIKVQAIKQISYVKSAAQAAGVTAEQARRTIDAIIKVDEAKKKLGGQGVIVGQKAGMINVINWLEDYYLPRIFRGRPSLETLQFTYASACIADEGINEYHPKGVKEIIKHGKDMLITQAKERAPGKYIGVVGVGVTEMSVVGQWLEDMNIQADRIQEYQTRQAALDALIKENYTVIERQGSNFNFITAGIKIEIAVDSWLSFEKLRPKFDWALAQSI